MIIGAAREQNRFESKQIWETESLKITFGCPTSSNFYAAKIKDFTSYVKFCADHEYVINLTKNLKVQVRF